MDVFQRDSVGGLACVVAGEVDVLDRVHVVAGGTPLNGLARLVGKFIAAIGQRHIDKEAVIVQYLAGHSYLDQGDLIPIVADLSRRLPAGVADVSGVIVLDRIGRVENLDLLFLIAILGGISGFDSTGQGGVKAVLKDGVGGILGAACLRHRNVVGEIGGHAAGAVLDIDLIFEVQISTALVAQGQLMLTHLIDAIRDGQGGSVGSNGEGLVGGEAVHSDVAIVLNPGQAVGIDHFTADLTTSKALMIAGKIEVLSQVDGRSVHGDLGGQRNRDG